MRICLIHPNYHSGGAEIAGNWPPAWVAYLSRRAQIGGLTDISFIDAMTAPYRRRMSCGVKLAEMQPDVVGTTAITPSIYKAERVLQIAKEVVPNALRILGGIHATFMYKQVLSEAPLDRRHRARRGRGDHRRVDPRSTTGAGRLSAPRSRGWPSATATEIVATPAARPSRISTASTPDWSLLEWDKYIYIPLGVKVAIPNMARGCPFTCSFCSSGSSGATTACAIPSRWWTRSRTW
jgi:anaerobic magnesium-protoporphyrin IX monomethyl ester cyclase